MTHESAKECWQRFFEQAQEELGDVHYDVLSDRADELLADDEAAACDNAYERGREEGWGKK